MEQNTMPVQSTVGEMAVFRAGEVGDIAAAMSANLEGESLSATDFDRIKIPAGGSTMWEIPALDGLVEAKEFKGIICLAQAGRLFWENEFNGENSPPDCVSTDSSVGIGSPGGSCDRCRYNQFGSSPKGGNGKACKDVRTVALLLGDNTLPLILNVPPTSLKAFKKYRMRLASQGRNMSHVVTTFSLAKAKNATNITYSEIVFGFAEALTPAQASQIDRYVDNLKPLFSQAHAQSVQGGEAYDSSGENPFGD